MYRTALRVCFSSLVKNVMNNDPEPRRVPDWAWNSSKQVGRRASWGVTFALLPFIIVPPVYVWALIDPNDSVFQHPMTSVGFLFSAIGMAVFIDTVGHWAFWSLFNLFISWWSRWNKPPPPRGKEARPHARSRASTFFGI